MTVSSVNDAPVAQPDAVYAAEDFPGISDNVLLNDSDVDDDDLTAQLVSGPSHASAFQLNPDGTFTYTPPTANFVGEDTFTYRAFDGTATSNVAVVHIHVGPSNDDVVARDDVNQTTAGVPIGGNVLTNDIAQNPDGPTEPLTVTSTGGEYQSTEGGMVNMQSNGEYTYTPAAGFTGVDTFTYTVTDGLTSDVGQVTVTVGAAVPNTPPVAVDDELETTAGTPVEFTIGDLLGNDSDPPDGDLIQIAGDGTLPANGTISYNDVTQVYTYTPNPGFFGKDTFTYTITDGQAESTATVTIDVDQPTGTAPPLAADDVLKIPPAPPRGRSRRIYCCPMTSISTMTICRSSRSDSRATAPSTSTPTATSSTPPPTPASPAPTPSPTARTTARTCRTWPPSSSTSAIPKPTPRRWRSTTNTPPRSTPRSRSRWTNGSAMTPIPTVTP